MDPVVSRHVPPSPSRFVPTEAIREAYGSRVDRLGFHLLESDPLGDRAAEVLATRSKAERSAIVTNVLSGGASADVPREVRDVVEHAASVPFWFDSRRGERGGRAFVRTALAGGLVLAFRSLVLGYTSPAGNKPLVFSGRLVEAAPRRVAETSHFVHSVTSPGGMARSGPGFASAVRVRLMHAEVRRQLLAAPGWRTETWGIPINQYDMAGTVLLFSDALADGLARLGLPFDDDAREDLLHLWRYVGHVLGVTPELLVASTRDAGELWEMILGTTAAPDDDSRALARALVAIPVRLPTTPRARKTAEAHVRFAYGLSRRLLGDEVADALGYPPTAWTDVLRALRPVFGAGRRVLGSSILSPAVGRVLDTNGARYWDRVVREGLVAGPATYTVDGPVRVS